MAKLFPTVRRAPCHFTIPLVWGNPRPYLLFDFLLLETDARRRIVERLTIVFFLSEISCFSILSAAGDGAKQTRSSGKTIDRTRPPCRFSYTDGISRSKFTFYSTAIKRRRLRGVLIMQFNNTAECGFFFA